MSKKISLDDNVNSNNTLDKVFEFPVQQPKKWDPEHPNLYTYRFTVEANGTTEMVERKIGFRQIEIRGNRVYVNNMPIKLRGVCRHEVDPLRGRSLTGDAWVKDVLLFREENVNYIRTSHYPPPEEFIRACDSLGMFVEVEAPFCWAHQTNVSAEQFIPALQTQTLDMVGFFRSHPSVLIWSIGNESMKYKEYFSNTAALVKQLDPSRPRNFSQWGPDADNNELEIGNHHYPGPEGPAKYADAKRPIVFDEYCHLNAYNRFELVTDPGIRDAWGIGMAAMWENMYNTPAVLGGALWAGIDDTFVLPDSTAVGYGTWGPIDGWRRKKPEYWHVKKTYSPVKISLVDNYKNSSVHISIENRLLFSNISDCKIQWHAGKYNGVINPSIAQREKQTVGISVNGKLSAADTMFIDVYDPRNVLIDQYAFAVVPEIKEQLEPQHALSMQVKYIKTDNNITAKTAGLQIVLNRETGNIDVVKPSSSTPILRLAQLMVLRLNGEGHGIQMTGEAKEFNPFTSTASNHIIKKIQYSCLPSKFSVLVFDEYDEASGYVVYEFSGDNNITIHYQYTLNKEIAPRQWGLVFSLANDFNTISWNRKGLWNYYPADDIGRLSGTANAMSSAPVSGPAGPVKKTTLPWYQDRTELGTNDFRSTKMNITNASVQGPNALLNIMADGTQSMRTWKENGQTRLLIAGYSNLGSEGFFRGHAEKFDKPLKQGDVIENTIHLTIK